MFCGGFREKDQNEIVLGEMSSLVAFKSILRYLYTSILPLEGLSFELMVEILVLLHKYQLEDLTKAFSDKMFTIAGLDFEKLLVLFDNCFLFGLKDTANSCMVELKGNNRNPGRKGLP